MIAELLFLLGMVPVGGFIENRLCADREEYADWIRLGAIAAMWAFYLTLTVPVAWRRLWLALEQEPPLGPRDRPSALLLGVLACTKRSATAALPAIFLILTLRYPRLSTMWWAVAPLLYVVHVAGGLMIRRQLRPAPQDAVLPIAQTDLVAELEQFARRRGVRHVQVRLYHPPTTTHGAAATCQRDRSLPKIFLNDRLVELLDGQEVLAVFAHELGHLRLRFLTLLTKATTLAVWGGAIVSFWLAGWAQEDRFYARPLSYLPILLVGAWLVWFFCHLFELAWNRSEERLANQLAVEMTGSAGPLVSATRKLAAYDPADTPSSWWERLLLADCLSAEQAIAQIRRYAARKGIPINEPMQPPGGDCVSCDRPADGNGRRPQGGHVRHVDSE
jgi:Zn-dependent protease with chaperone function